MARLFLTADGVSATMLTQAGRADLVVALQPRFVWGPPASDAELSGFLAPRTTQPKSGHWLDHGAFGDFATIGGRRHGLLELVERCDSVELWMETPPNDQLVLIWLLDYLSDHPQLAAKIVLRHIDVPLFNPKPVGLSNAIFVGVNLCSDHLAIGSRAWRAYRSPTPQPWYALLDEKTDLLPQLRRTVFKLLDELPRLQSGLGITELRMLDLLDRGRGAMHALINRVVYLEPIDTRTPFNYYEAADLLEALAFAPRPAVSGVDPGLRTRERVNLRLQHELHQSSRPVITPLGLDILDGRDDYSRHNPVHRWWGGTKLTNGNLWRWDPIGNVLIAP
jgi:hypothetical protein